MSRHKNKFNELNYDFYNFFSSSDYRKRINKQTRTLKFNNAAIITIANTEELKIYYKNITHELFPDKKKALVLIRQRRRRDGINCFAFLFSLPSKKHLFYNFYVPLTHLCRDLIQPKTIIINFFAFRRNNTTR